MMRDLVERLREMLSDNDDLPDEASTSGLLNDLTFGDLRALLDRIEALESLLTRIEPYIDAIVCYASTMDEHEPNRIAVDLRATLNRRDDNG